MALIDTPHIKWPASRGPDGKLLTVEQDTPEHVLSCEHFIVRCPVNYRVDRPEFGWPIPIGRNMPISPGELENALRTWEPRGTTAVSEFMDAIDPGVEDLLVETDVEAD